MAASRQRTDDTRDDPPKRTIEISWDDAFDNKPASAGCL